MIKRWAILFGAILIVVGGLGLIPALTPAGLLFGVFVVNPLHNMVHIITGLIALAVGFSNERASTVYFQVFGILYALVAVLGFFRGNAPMWGMAHNTPDAGLHLLIAAVALYIGYMLPHMHWRIPHWRWRH
jgi:hypothetical protein